jgi:hypothetical protein
MSVHGRLTLIAVHNAVAGLKVKPPPEAGPYVYVHPGLICGLIHVGPLVEFDGLNKSPPRLRNMCRRKPA